MKEAVLTEKQARIISAMIEKQITTPQYYPMTVNAVRTACNQKSNRNPVLDFSDDEVFELLEGLVLRGFLKRGLFDLSRTTKYEQHFDIIYGLERKETAILCELFLRGSQTLGELKSHCERMISFDGIAEAERVLAELSKKGHVVMLDRIPGQKERRWAHLFFGEPEIPEIAPRSAIPAASTLEKRVADLEGRMEQVLEALKAIEAKISRTAT